MEGKWDKMGVKRFTPLILAFSLMLQTGWSSDRQRLQRLETEGSVIMKQKTDGVYIELPPIREKSEYTHILIYNDKYGCINAAYWHSKKSIFSNVGKGIQDPYTINLNEALEGIREGRDYTSSIKNEKVGNLQEKVYAENFSEKGFPKAQLELVMREKGKKEFDVSKIQEAIKPLVEKNKIKNVDKDRVKIKMADIELRRIEDPKQGFGIAPGWGFVDKLKMGEGLEILNDVGLSQ